MCSVINTGTAHFIKEKSNEDLETLHSLENILLSKRGYIVKIPQPNTPVVACLSGGMDTVGNLAILMQEFKLRVFPFFVNRGQSNYKWEKRSAEFFDGFFMDKFPEQYNKYKEITVESPAKEYKNELRKVKESEKIGNIGYPARNPMIVLTGMEYAYSLRNMGENINTVFTSFMAEDPINHSTLTAVRALNVLMCQIMGDCGWQLISLPIEKEFGNYYGKDIYVRWCAENNIPLEETRSCYKDTELHCGTCFPACQNRKEAFKKAGVEDKTKYLI